MLAIQTILILFVISSAFRSSAQQVDDTLLKDLDGEYKLVNRTGILNITGDPFLTSICPSLLSLTKSGGPMQFDLRIGSKTESSKTHCKSGANSSIPMTFTRVQPFAESDADAQQGGQETLSHQEISGFFPLFRAFSPTTLVCPNQTEIFTQIVAQDTGYWFTLVNHYKASGDPLGSPFNETDPGNLNVIRGMYALNLAVDFEHGCTYLKASEESKLRMEVDEILSPESTPTPSSGESNESKCFPSDAKVELADGSLVSMAELKIGDKVRDSSGSSSRVLLFTHADPRVKSEFVVIHTGTAKVALSATHYIYLGDKLVPAAAIKVGDEITVVKRRARASIGARVMKVEREILSGLYNPQTETGSIVVSWHGEGVLASTYTAAVPPVTAHALLGPLRFLGVCFDITIPQLSLFFTSSVDEKSLVASVLLDKVVYPKSEFRRFSRVASPRKW